MTKETINLIIGWFEHIQQMATDRKTLTGATMDAQQCLNEIAAIASDSKQFIKEYQYKQEPINEEELDKLAEEYCPLYPKYIDADTVDIQEAYREGYRQAKQK